MTKTRKPASTNNHQLRKIGKARVALKIEKTCTLTNVIFYLQQYCLDMPELIHLNLTEADYLSLAKEILNTCRNDRIFAFYGHLGAGKTTLIKRFCEALDLEVTVTSPTFNLVNEYHRDEYVVYHFDFYRIKSEIEAYDMGCNEYFDSGSYCFIEWPELIPTLLPSDAIQIRISSNLDETRNIQVIY